MPAGYPASTNCWPAGERRTESVNGKLPEISVAIPVLNGAETLPALVQALAEQTGVRITSRIAVDSGSTDRSREILERAGFRVIQRPRAEFNHGRTRNHLMEYTDAPLVAFFSQDAVPAHREMLHELSLPFDISSRVMGASARQISRPKASRLDRLRLGRSGAGRKDAFRATKYGLRELSPAGLVERCRFHNAASMVRRQGFRPFPEVEIAEDLCWARQVLEEGGEIAYAPSAKVYHSVERPLGEEWARLRTEARVLATQFGYEPVRSPGDAVRKGLVWGLGDAAAVLVTPGRAPLRSAGRAAAMGALRAYSFWKEW